MLNKHNLLDVIAIVFSLVAIIVSLGSNRISSEANSLAQEANDLASQDFDSKVVLLSSDFLSNYMFGGDHGELYYIMCASSVSMVNLGGVAASITEFIPTTYFRGAEQKIEGDPYIILTLGLLPRSIQDIETRITSLDKYYAFDESFFLNDDKPVDLNMFKDPTTQLPLKLEGKNTLDFIVLVLFTVAKISESLDFTPKYLTATLGGEGIEGYLPFQLSYTFKLSSGELVPTNRFTCFQMH